MRIARFSLDDEVDFGVVDGDEVAPITGHPFAPFTFTGYRYPLADVKLLAPVIPSKIIAVGKNYAAHAAELATGPVEAPEAPILFLKPSTSVIGCGEKIVLPPSSERVDFEGELAIVIGRLCKDVPRERVTDVILGYTIANDVTARDQQLADKQWMRSKSYDTFCPLGPWLETAIDPNDVGITTTVNGVVKQHGRTSEMIFDITTIVAYVSSVMTLLPGDIILTGTPAGVGPMSAGDAVSITIEGIGTLDNGVVAGV
ncbi:MAG: 5-carboxymethyl-2-hydroxymuconateDelta-isomerase [Frankiales bacterium]|nr:5-carboxymethyl-2-hydroxymuconateDelta-isomerase [Frankiales bacterium]